MNRYEALIAERTSERRRAADSAAESVLEALRERGIDIRVFGSLARGDFKSHSDVDFLVRGAVSRNVRVAVETTLARVMGESALPYDVIYLDDLTAEQAAVFDRA